VTEAEAISPAELDAYLTALIGGDSSSIDGEVYFTSKIFSNDILGFEAEVDIHS
jgi:hypothetical protein